MFDGSTMDGVDSLRGLGEYDPVPENHRWVNRLRI